jgi:hypothetical protein
MSVSVSGPLFGRCDDNLPRVYVIEIPHRRFFNFDIPKMETQPPLLTGKCVFGVQTLMQVFTLGQYEEVLMTAFRTAAISAWSLTSDIRNAALQSQLFRRNPNFGLKVRISCRNQF